MSPPVAAGSGYLILAGNMVPEADLPDSGGRLR